MRGHVNRINTISFSKLYLTDHCLSLNPICITKINFSFPSFSSLSKQTRANWLLEVCKEHVKKYVFNTDELTSLIKQRTELEVGLNQDSRWKCRADDCDRTYAHHSGRIRKCPFILILIPNNLLQ